MIRLNILIAVGMLVFTQLSAQLMGWHLQLPSSFKTGDVQWVDLDNDGLLDILLLSTDQSGNAFLNIIKEDTSARALEINKTHSIIPFQGYTLTDYNRDNKIDLLVSSSTSTAVYINKGNFNFEEKLLSIEPFLQARFTDLDNNALPELIVSGESGSGFYFRILQQTAEYNWKVVHDSIDIKCTSIEVLDADGDGDNDLFVSGELKADSIMSGFLINEGGFFKPQYTISFKGKVATGDLDNDGFFEVILVNEAGVGKKFKRASNSYTVEDMSVALKNVKTFIADLTFDGKADVIYSGINSSGEPAIETVLSNGMDSIIVHRENTVYGDLDHDGRLDAVSLMGRNTFLLSLLVNKVAKSNGAPSKPKNAVALPIFDRVFMYWDKPADDLTPQASLTYDVTLKGAASNYQVGEFDLPTEKRLTVTHGNNGTNNFKLLKYVEINNLNFSIQAIDNSFHAGTLCVGQGTTSCGDLLVEELAACSSQEVILTAPPDALWFSFAKGFLGKTNRLSIIPDKTDTLFYFSPASSGCAALKTWKINVENPDLKVSADHYKIIKGSEVQLHADGAERYVWSPAIGLDRSDIASPVASPLTSIVYTVTGFDSNGCSSSATINITVENTSFIPTLFSPNEDGQNDQLRIYGLSGAQNFSFSIYDREGALVYKTSDLSEAVQRGWDGTKNGTHQPAGVYFWKVRGESPDGQVLLNGKDSGSVVLIR